MPADLNSNRDTQKQMKNRILKMYEQIWALNYCFANLCLQANGTTQEN
jgi:hypothetical protein